MISNFISSISPYGIQRKVIFHIINTFTNSISRIWFCRIRFQCPSYKIFTIKGSFQYRFSINYISLPCNRANCIVISYFIFSICFIVNFTHILCLRT